MRHRIVPVKNVARLSEASDALIQRGLGMPGMGLIWGHTGYGKTTAATWLINRVNGVYVRPIATTTPSTFLGSILRELDQEPKGSCAQMVERIVERLATSMRPLFVDEADYVADSKKLTETLRDIHDLSTVPVVLIGMAGIQRKLAQRQQLAGRIAQWVEFTAADLEDARALADGLCEVGVADDLLERLHRASGGEIRRITVGLGRIEQHAKARSLDVIGAADWTLGDEGFFLPRAGGDAPKRAGGKVAAIQGAR
ncbi:AAA family ATPase [Arhodomonas sp. AD133]|uniref:AAA family ATPase n=1 Tax=Arhodomonas sp. AD133 TaxID=3415009 RepID=UPI003EBDF60D